MLYSLIPIFNCEVYLNLKKQESSNAGSETNVNETRETDLLIDSFAGEWVYRRAGGVGCT